MSEKLTIRQWRLVRGLTLIQASRLMGVHSNTLQRWELGDIDIPEVTRIGIAMIYGIQTDQVKWED